jgi:FSR family fosmidomycin resistance protein-like MFS transporter
MGVASNVFFLVLTILAGGMGISCFHPIATAMASGMTTRYKGMAIAFFVTAGTSGYAIGPVFISWLVDCFGMNWMPLAAIPALIVVIIWMFFGPKSLEGIGKNNGASTSREEDVKLPIRPIFLLTASSFIRAFVILSFTNFIAFYLEKMGLGLQSRSFYIFAIQIGGALGVLVCGGLADRVGRWRIMFWSPLASLPLFYLFLATDGLFSLMILFLAGFFIFASVPAVVVSAQKMMAQRESMASALQIGFAWGSGGLLMGLVGHFGEVFGIYPVLMLVASLPVLLTLMALLLKPYQSQFEVNSTGAVPS